MKRRDKTNYYLDIATVVLERGTCLRRSYGAIIVKNCTVFKLVGLGFGLTAILVAITESGREKVVCGKL